MPNKPKVMNLHSYYLHYDTKKFEHNSRDPHKKRPSWFSYDLCLLNFLKTLAGVSHPGQLTFTLWYDGPLNELVVSEEIRGALKHAESTGVIVEIVGGHFGSGSQSAYNLQHYIAAHRSIDDDDIVYTLENDYLHQPNWLNKVNELYYSDIQFDYISLYDHADNYRLPVHRRFKSEIFATTSQIWRTCFSTCYSKLARGRTMREDLLTLTQYDDYFACSLLQLTGRTLMVSTPGLSTHAMAGLESPAIDWDKMAGLF